MGAITWLFTNPNSVTDTEQVKTGEISNGFYFWLLGYLHLVGLDMDKILMLGIFSAPHESENLKRIFFLNTGTRCFEKDTQFLCLELAGSFPASFASGHENIWSLGILSSRDPSSPTWLGGQCWRHISPLKWSLHQEHGQSSCGAWGTPAPAEGQPLGWV